MLEERKAISFKQANDRNIDIAAALCAVASSNTRAFVKAEKGRVAVFKRSNRIGGRARL